MKQPRRRLTAVDAVIAVALGLTVAISVYGFEVRTGSWPDDGALAGWAAAQHSRGLLIPLGAPPMALPALWATAGTVGLACFLRRLGVGWLWVGVAVVLPPTLHASAQGLLVAALLPAWLATEVLWARGPVLRAALLAGVGATGAMLAEGLGAAMVVTVAVVSLGTRHQPREAGLWLGAAGVLLALGPTVSGFDQPLSVAGRLVPGPAALLELVGIQPTSGWLPLAALLVVGVVAVLTRGSERTQTALERGVLAVVVGFGALVQYPPLGRALLKNVVIEKVFELHSVSTLAVLDGPVVHLPAQSQGPSTADIDTTLLMLRAFAGHDPWGVSVADGSPHVVFADPLLPLFWNATIDPDQPEWAIPPGGPGEALETAGVVWVVVHRDWVRDGAMAGLEPILRRHLGLPQRDLVANLDLYRLDPKGGTVEPVEPVFIGEPLPDGWRNQSDALKVWSSASR